MPKLRTCGASAPALPGRRGRASGAGFRYAGARRRSRLDVGLAVGVAGAAIPHREVIGIAADRRVRKVAQPVLCQRQRGDFVCIRCGGPLHASSRQCLVVKQFPERDLECRGLDLCRSGPPGVALIVKGLDVLQLRRIGDQCGRRQFVVFQAGRGDEIGRIDGNASADIGTECQEAGAVGQIADLEAAGRDAPSKPSTFTLKSTSPVLIPRLESVGQQCVACALPANIVTAAATARPTP